MSTGLILKPKCGECGSNSDLYGSDCKHMTLCVSCGTTMAENKAKCHDCGAILTRLIREYDIQASRVGDKNYFIGKFVTGLPKFSKKKKKSAENKWSLRKDMEEKYKNKPWVLEDETGQSHYQGQFEGAKTAFYYLLMAQSKEFTFSAIPAGSWFSFNKVAQYKQLTLEEAEEKMKNRKKTQDGYDRWMMKSGPNRAPPDKDTDAAGGKGCKETIGEDDEENFSDKGEDDEEEETAKKRRLGLNKNGGDDEDDKGGNEDDDMDDDGDGWEHEEIFTDDDEAVGINPEEREDFEPEVPPPPEIKQDDEDNDVNEEEGGLSKTGKELKKLLGRSGSLNGSDANTWDDDLALHLVVPPKQKDAPKQEPVDSSPVKPVPSGSAAKLNPSASKSAKGKRKLNGDDTKASNSAPPKKVKTDNEKKSSTKQEPASESTPSSKTGSTPSVPSGPVTEEEIRDVLKLRSPITVRELLNNFPGRVNSKEGKAAFQAILMNKFKLQKNNGIIYVVLKDK